MALITCKKCGKKFSDTVSVCIHCGHNPALPYEAPINDALPKTEASSENAIIEEANKITPESTEDTAQITNNESDKNKKTIKYDDLTLAEQLRLDDEFALANPEHLKHAQIYDVLATFCGAALSFIFFGLLISFGWGVLANSFVSNYELFPLVVVGGVVLSVISLITTVITFIIMRIYAKRTRGAKKYNEDFKNWLLNKNIIHE